MAGLYGVGMVVYQEKLDGGTWAGLQVGEGGLGRSALGEGVVETVFRVGELAL